MLYFCQKLLNFQGTQALIQVRSLSILQKMDTQPNGIPQNLNNILKGYKQVCSDYSCDKCTRMQNYLGIYNPTGSTVLSNGGKRGKQRLKLEYFLQDDWNWDWWLENIG